ncbi:prephenate dehydrogenase [Enterococcus xiangfangensis]|uniref:Prephenate dehydrogenase n=1 Tax=Enterococcus xiangfangensis TaxID=1296537 RepID=A0ABU3FC61_9ENTE|nr:prephenate dehydrogenase [Enterococcus xiangfangensis]MDT2760249.1 prephenate dehydrogenase [Enterococcus xiangfangensis]
MKQQVMVLGLGLIGASLCRAINNPTIELFGWDYSSETCEIAREVGLVDQIASIERAPEMDIIILAVPVRSTLQYLQKLAKLSLKESVIVTDTGSTKNEVMELAKTLPFTFIGGHPMAGSHKSGVKAENPNLFEEAYYILTPPKGIKTNSLIKLLEPTRAKFVELEPESHDEIVGVLSHLPHIVAAGLVKMSDQLVLDYPRATQLAAGGFRDITRIASSDPQMWTDILLTNRSILLDLLHDWQKEITTIQESLIQEDQSAIYDFFSEAKHSRDHLPAKDRGVIPAFYDLYVDIPDTAGAIAEVMTLLSKADISIVNLKIQETREDIYGVLELSFKNQTDLEKGQSVIEEADFHCCRRS